MEWDRVPSPPSKDEHSASVSVSPPATGFQGGGVVCARTAHGSAWLCRVPGLPWTETDVPSACRCRGVCVALASALGRRRPRRRPDDATVAPPPPGRPGRQGSALIQGLRQITSVFVSKTHTKNKQGQQYKRPSHHHPRMRGRMLEGGGGALGGGPYDDDPPGPPRPPGPPDPSRHP